MNDSKIQALSMSNLRIHQNVSFLTVQKKTLPQQATLNILPSIPYPNASHMAWISVGLAIAGIFLHKILNHHMNVALKPIPIFANNRTNLLPQYTQNNILLLKTNELSAKEILRQYEKTYNIKYGGQFSPLTSDENKQRSILYQLIEFLKNLIADKNSKANFN